MLKGPGLAIVEITALAIGYGHLVPADTVSVERRVETNRGMLSYEFPVAGLAPWLCLKADAIMRRDKPKDAYDVVWLLDALGLDQASELIATSPLLTGDHIGEVSDQLLRLINDQFKDTDSAGSVMYADFLEAKPGDLERRHAHGTLAAFRDAPQLRGIHLTLVASRGVRPPSAGTGSSSQYFSQPSPEGTAEVRRCWYTSPTMRGSK